MYILGISAFYHDSAASLIKDGTIIAAAQEERFTRRKFDHTFPHNAILYCIQEAGITPEQLTHVVFYEKPFLKFERLLETYLAFAPKGFKSFAASMPIWIKDKLFQKSVLCNELKSILNKNIDWSKILLFSEHHLSHAASAYYPSPFNSAAVLTLDGVGEWTTTSLAIGEKNNLNVIKEIHFPHSLGLLYSAFTYHAGFKVNSGEYKLMGLAPYGKPKYLTLIKDNLIDVADDGSYKLNMSYFDYATGLTMTNNKFNQLFGRIPRNPKSNLSQFDMDMAASVQKVTEEIILKLAKNIKKETNKSNLCLAGGVALNCVANGILQKEKIFDDIWIQPAAGDAGGSLGAALAAWYKHLNKTRRVSNNSDSMSGSYLGPQFSDDEIEDQLVQCGAVFKKYSESDLINHTAYSISEHKAIGWMQGRMEFGPRALGSRSIIADPRSPTMQKILNLKVKYRESFRPFAPSVLSEYVEEWFDMEVDSPYMLYIAKVNKHKTKEMSESDKKLFGIDKLNVIRSSIPAVTHIDYSARIQTVHKETNHLYHKLISQFNKLTGYPLLINTSFNIRGEPIVCSPTDAFNCFMGTDLDMLVIGNFILNKSDQNIKQNAKYRDKYEMD